MLQHNETLATVGSLDFERRNFRWARNERLRQAGAAALSVLSFGWGWLKRSRSKSGVARRIGRKSGP
jgi:hypothetical protein